MTIAKNKKTVLITGCSSGFGLLTAARLASKGHRVIATLRDLNKAGALKNEVDRRSALVDILQLDVTKKSSIKAAFNEIGGRYGYIDVLINNAGFGIGGFFEDLTEEEIREQFETNFFGVQSVTREALTLMRPRRSGKIINISSTAGFTTSPCFSAYNASKWALEAFSESLHYELKLFGISVCLIEPGTYRTKIFSENARYAKNFDHPDSPYFLISQRLRKRVLDYVQDSHKDPEEIAILAEKLINAKNPPLRNIPDIESQALYILRRILPFSVYSWLIQKALLKEVSPNQ